MKVKTEGFQHGYQSAVSLGWFLCPLALMLITIKVSHAQQAFEQPMDQNPESEQQGSGLPMQQDPNQPRISVPPPVVPNPQGYPSPGSTPIPVKRFFRHRMAFQEAIRGLHGLR